MTWSTDRGESGTTTAVGEWSVEVPLQPGDNVVTVTASSEETEGTTDTITITHNPHLAFERPVTISPAESFVNEQVEAVVQVGILVNDDLDASSVRVVAVDDDNVVLGDLFLLADDGNTATGDELPGDGIFSGVYAFNEPEHTEIRLRVLADTSGANGIHTAQSELFTFSVVEPLTLENADRMEAVSNEADATYDTILATTDHVEAAAQTVAFLLSQTDVLQAGAADNGRAVWWELEVGPGRSVEQGLSKGPPGTNSDPTLSKTSATIMEPYYSVWGQSDQQIGDHLEELFTNTWCPKLHPVDTLLDAQVTVEKFKELYKYGLIAIHSHGWLWGSGANAKAAIWTTEIAFPHDYIAGLGGKYAADVAKKRLQVWKDKGFFYYAVAPKFFEEYHKNNLDGAVIFNDTCHGMSDLSNGTGSLFWTLIKESRVAIYLGFKGSVGTKWGVKWTKSFFDALLLGNNVQEAWMHGIRMHGKRDPGGDAQIMIKYRDLSKMKLTVARQCDGYMKVTHEYTSVAGETIIKEKATLQSTGTLVQAPWMEGSYELTSEEAQCTYEDEVFSHGQKTSDETGTGQLVEYYDDPDSGSSGTGKLKLCIDEQNQKIYIFPIVHFTEDDWVTYDLTTYPVGPLPGGNETHYSDCMVKSVLFAASQSTGTGSCALMGPAMLEFDVPADGQIGEDFVEGKKVFGTAFGTATVEFAYRLRE